MTLCLRERLYFRDQLRAGRAVVLKNAENFSEILFTLERLGFYLARKNAKARTLADYKGPLAALIPDEQKQHRSEFCSLFEHVRAGRNDALHQGAVARHLARDTVKIACMVEDALMAGKQRVTHFMVTTPVLAETWWPLQFARQTMLENSFSYLPMLDASAGWRIVSDLSIAHYLASGSRQGRLKETLTEAGSEIASEPTRVLKKWTRKRALKAIASGNHQIALVFEREEDSDANLLGIVTPFDLL